jgi:hypothetical protein
MEESSVAYNVIKRIDYDILNSRLSADAIQADSNKVSNYFAEEIINNIENENLNEELGKIQNYVLQFDAAEVESSFGKLEKIVKTNTPEGRIAGKFLDKAKEPLQTLMVKYGICQAVVQSGYSIKEDIESCNQASDAVLNSLYEKIREWGNKAGAKEKEFFEDTKLKFNKLSKEDFLNETSFKRVTAFFSHMKEDLMTNVKKRYEDMLNMKLEYSYVYKAIEEAGLKGKEVDTITANELFEKNYPLMKNQDGQKMGAKFPFKTSDLYAIKLEIYRKHLGDFIEGIDYYNDLTKQKETWNEGFEKINQEFSSEIEEIITGYKKSLAGNQFFNNLGKYVEMHKPWINKIINIE